MTPSPNQRPNPSPAPSQPPAPHVRNLEPAGEPDRRRRRPSPSPSPDPSQSPPKSRRGAGSSASSKPGSSATEFVADAGPAFDPKHAPPAPELEAIEEPEDQWDEKRIRELLILQGEITHAALRVGPDDKDTWVHTERDLASIAPPMTRILNRYDLTRAAAAAGDEILLASALARYGARNFTRRRRLQAALAAEGPQPVTGVPAEPDTGPASDPGWQRVHEPPPALTPKGARR